MTPKTFLLFPGKHFWKFRSEVKIIFSTASFFDIAKLHSFQTCIGERRWMHVHWLFRVARVAHKLTSRLSKVSLCGCFPQPLPASLKNCPLKEYSVRSEKRDNIESRGFNKPQRIKDHGPCPFQSLHIKMIHLVFLTFMEASHRKHLRTTLTTNASTETDVTKLIILSCIM